MEPAKTPQGVIGRMSASVRDAVGQRRSTGFYYLMGVLLALVPLWWRSRAAWFSLIFMAVAWIWMAMTHDAGAAAHHVVLLWPFPILFAVAALRRMPGWALLAVGLGMVGSNLLVVNQYLVQLHRNGAFNTFTDAIYPLSDALDEGAENTIYVTDWGMFDSLNLLHQGDLHLSAAAGPLVPQKQSMEEAQELERRWFDPDGLLVGHVAGLEAFPDVGKHLDAAVQAAGLRREIVRTIADSNGRPIFEISRVVQAH
jgi:hypothetical protein